LNVELLNRVMCKLKTWTQPVIMIPGNHDQVTLGGAVHALTPLKYAGAGGAAVTANRAAIGGTANQANTRLWEERETGREKGRERGTSGLPSHYIDYSEEDNLILMIDEPSICKNALWLPYRRDKMVMKQVLDYAATLIPRHLQNHDTDTNTSPSLHQQRAIEERERESISMIFCHADVRGAWMNDNIQSRDGLDVTSFPPAIPIYSGHFHKPHLVS
jgi:DNA repair exonuclease SbcCD nuclease subunit